MKDRIHIVYVIKELDVGGAERALYHLATRIDRKHFSPEVVALYGRGEIGCWLTQKGVPVTYLDMTPEFDLRVMPHLRALLMKRRTHILHSFLFQANFIGRIAARLTHVPVVISSLRVAERRKRDLWLDRLTIDLVDIETCVSEGVRRWAIKRAGIPAHKLVTIHNGVDVARFTMEQRSARRKLGLPLDPPLILTVGRLDRQKGLPYLIEAASEVVRQFSSAQFLIAGIGPLEAKLLRHIRQRKLQEHVHLLGFRDDIPDLLAAADLFVLPSLWEGLANVLLEAMAASKAVVTTDVEGCAEVVVDGETGVLVPPADSHALAQAICVLLSHPERARVMGERAREVVAQRFTLSSMVQQHEKLYRDLLAHPRR